MNNAPLRSTVLITSKNRREDLATAVKSALSQDANPEVIVIDDGSTDGTSEMIRNLFPEVRLFSYSDSAGLIKRRNEGTRLASGDIIFSLDDDAVYSSPDTVASALKEFNSDSIGAIALPFIDVRKSPEIKQKPYDALRTWLTFGFVGTAYAVRKDVFLTVGGFNEYLFHQGEEMDFSIRMMDQDKYVKLASTPPVFHFESPRRDFKRMDIFGRRNDIIFSWINVPALWLAPHLLMTLWNGIRHGFRTKRVKNMCIGLFRGLCACIDPACVRRPVQSKTYLLFRRLKKRPIEISVALART
jgi:glycosyltransferase involved in cell wall biosynthesis